MKKITKNDRQDFIKKYNINPAKLRHACITMKDAENIINDFEKTIINLESIGFSLTNILQKCEDVHSVRFRVKNPEHLIEKIIRKNSENPNRKITIDNYKEEITDLIGIRILHIFKDEWINIHNFIIKMFHLYEDPKVYHKKGDSDLFLQKYIDKNLKTEEHKFEYRSIHYVIEVNTTKIPTFAEIQVRTIYEEGWSEIDHRIRYPNNKDQKVVGQALHILNSLSHTADEFGSFINNFNNIYLDLNHEIKDKEKQIKELFKEIENVPLPSKIKSLLKEKFINITNIENDANNAIQEAMLKVKHLDLGININE